MTSKGPKNSSYNLQVKDLPAAAFAGCSNSTKAAADQLIDGRLEAYYFINYAVCFVCGRGF